MNNNYIFDKDKIYTIDNAHISTIKVGDTVLHNGEIKTVGRNNIKYISGIGYTLWGDSYTLGHKPVQKVTFHYKDSKGNIHRCA